MRNESATERTKSNSLLPLGDLHVGAAKSMKRNTERDSKGRSISPMFTRCKRWAALFSGFSLLLAGCGLEVKPTLAPPLRSADASDAPDEAHQPEIIKTTVAPKINVDDLPPPKIEVTKTDYDFGVMDPFQVGQHTFKVKNVGEGPLLFVDHRSSCSCTASEFTKRAIQPGEETEVLVAWETKTTNERFRESTTLVTNDPEQHEIRFNIEGNVLVHVGADPAEIDFGRVRPDDKPKATTIVSSQTWDHFELAEFSSSVEGATWEIEPAPAEELEKLNAKSGYRVTVELPQLVRGPFREWLRFEVRPDDESLGTREFQMPLAGKVLRRLAVYGKGIDKHGNIQLGVAIARKGLRHRMFLKVYDDETKLAVQGIEVHPEYLNVQVTPDEKQGDQGLYRLEIEVPVDAPAGRYQAQNAGELTIRFDHPRIKELRLRLHLAVADLVEDQVHRRQSNVWPSVDSVVTTNR